MSHRNLLIAALLSAPLCALGGVADASPSCSKSDAPATLRYASYPPLLGGGEHTATRVTLHQDGCVVVQFPERSQLRGSHAFQLGDSEHTAILAGIDSWRLQRIEPGELRRSLDTVMKQRVVQKSQMSVTAVRDEPLIRFEILQNGKAAGRLLYPSLQQDWANHPDNLDVAALHQAQSAMSNLISQAVHARTQEKSP